MRVDRIVKLVAGVLAALTWAAAAPARAQPAPPSAEGLAERIVTVDLGDGASQAGVLSIRQGTRGHTHLAVLLPGSPSVLRPRVAEGGGVETRLAGNFLIRARRHLLDDTIAALLVDCRSDSGDECRDAYQASPQRFADVSRLVDAVRREIPSLRSVWLVGTSMGTISSSYLAKHGAGAFDGAIHTASITDAGPFNRSMRDFDYASVRIPQVFIHHREDPCRFTAYAGARDIAERNGIALVTVAGGGDYRGAPCQAFTQHGFRGVEPAVMRAISEIVRTGAPGSLEIR